MSEQVTAEQKIKHLILIRREELDGDEASVNLAKGITPGDVEERYDEMVENEEHWDAVSEARAGEVETGLPCDYSRYYESKAVAAQYLDGSWVGWTYWYGGGKHGQPDTIDWIEYGYDLSCTEEEKVVTVRTFEKRE